MNSIWVNGAPQRKVYLGLFLVYLTGVFWDIMVFRVIVTNCNVTNTKYSFSITLLSCIILQAQFPELTTSGIHVIVQ